MATGSYQRRAGQDYLLSMSQQAIGRCIHEVSEAISTILGPIWISFPTTGFPGTISAIDCTHVYLLKPIVEKYNYVNRRGRHSKNVQIICDYDLEILSVNARHVGATHDLFIWNNSLIKDELERNYNHEDNATWLIGDSGYAQQPWLMTPFLATIPGSPEARYNQAQRRARNCVERCIGVACIILHNMCVSVEPDEIIEILSDDVTPEQPSPAHNIGAIRRDFVVQNYFA